MPVAASFLGIQIISRQIEFAVDQTGSAAARQSTRGLFAPRLLARSIMLLARRLPAAEVNRASPHSVPIEITAGNLSGRDIRREILEHMRRERISLGVEVLRGCKLSNIPWISRKRRGVAGRLLPPVSPATQIERVNGFSERLPSTIPHRSRRARPEFGFADAVSTARISTASGDRDTRGYSLSGISPGSFCKKLRWVA